jgi:hypothetical protein
MYIKVNLQDVEHEYNKVVREDLLYRLSNSAGNLSEVDISFPLQISEGVIPAENTSRVFVLKNYYHAINNILEFRIEQNLALKPYGTPSVNGVIGNIFSLKALLDEDNNTDIFGNKRYSEVYAFTAFDIVLKNTDKISLKPKVIGGEQNDLLFSDLYDDDVLFLVINERLLVNPHDFKIENYLCDLYKYGFYIADQHNLEISYNDVKLREGDELTLIEENYNEAVNNGNFIKVVESSNSIKITLDSYYYTLLYKHILEKNDALNRFIVLYQIIELLKDGVLEIEILSLLENASNYNGHTLRAKTNDFSDAKLINRLFSSDYSKFSANVTKALSESIKKLLDENNEQEENERNNFTVNLQSWFRNNPFGENEDAVIETITNFEISKRIKDTFPKLLYKFRNVLLHNYSSFPNDKNTVKRIKTIIKLFEYVIIELIISFKKPNEIEIEKIERG